MCSTHTHFQLHFLLCAGLGTYIAYNTLICFWPQKEKVKGRKNYAVRRFIICIHHLVLLGWLNQGIWDGWDIQHLQGKWDYSILARPLQRKTLRMPRHKSSYISTHGLHSLCATYFLTCCTHLDDSLPFGISFHFHDQKDSLLFILKTCPCHHTCYLLICIPRCLPFISYSLFFGY